MKLFKTIEHPWILLTIALLLFSVSSVGFAQTIASSPALPGKVVYCSVTNLGNFTDIGEMRFINKSGDTILSWTIGDIGSGVTQDGWVTTAEDTANPPRPPYRCEVVLPPGNFALSFCTVNAPKGKHTTACVTF